MYSPETEARLSELRAIGQTRKLTAEEAAEAIRIIRQDRVSASYASANAKKAAAPKSDPAAALEKLKGLLGGS